ncbi:MAG TPA: thiol reductant ABC exporter subunit CydD [Acidimicrobiales bacterium]|nr:thiol reductant ABC exporter subunit CydD [Acidimicrobiales bacterium]
MTQRKGPVDPRLVQLSRGTRAHLATTVVLGALTALLVIAQAWLLASVIARAFDGSVTVGHARGQLIALLAVVLARALVAWWSEVSANRASSKVKSELRIALVEKLAADGPTERAGSDGHLATLATHGVDALDGYFSRYLPQLVLAVIVPVAVIVAVCTADWISAVIIAVTIPLIPIFMALIGMRVQRKQDHQLRTLQVLSGHFLDVVRGLTTLKVFGRSKAQVETIKAVTESYRRTTMSTLRLAFLSSLVLELLASVSVALVAVSVGLRLLYGHLDLQASLFALVLAPEAYLPLRLVGTHYHASAEGLSAADQVFAVLERPSPPRGTCTDIPDPSTHAVVVDHVEVSYPNRDRSALFDCSLTIEPGEVLAITGSSGCGKSTLLNVLLGFVTPDHGEVHVGSVPLHEMDLDVWRRSIAWVPQRPHLFARTIAENLRIGRPEATDDELWAALTAASLQHRVAAMPAGLDTQVGERGAGLSVGEAQRLALARAFVRDAPLLLLDEPTAHLDLDTEARVIDSLRTVAKGRTVVIVTHRPAALTIADRVVALEPAAVGALR